MISVRNAYFAFALALLVGLISGISSALVGLDSTIPGAIVGGTLCYILNVRTYRK